MSQTNTARTPTGRMWLAAAAVGLLLVLGAVIFLSLLWAPSTTGRISADRAWQVVSGRLLSANSTVTLGSGSMSMAYRLQLVAWLNAHWPTNEPWQSYDLPKKDLVGGGQRADLAPDMCVDCASTYIDPATGQGMPTHMQILGFGGSSAWVILYVPQVNAVDDWCRVVIQVPPPVAFCQPPPLPPPEEGEWVR